MSRKPVFYSFHFDNDALRAQQIRNIGSLDGNSPASPNKWEGIRRSGDAAIKRWIDETMKYKRCLIVLIGLETANRPYVQYEIEKAWNEGKGVLGMYVHNIRCPRNGTCRKGPNPFDRIGLQNGNKLSSLVQCYDPDPNNAYRDVSANIANWIDDAIARRR